MRMYMRYVCAKLYKIFYFRINNNVHDKILKFIALIVTLFYLRVYNIQEYI